MPKGYLPPISPPEPQEAARAAPRVKAKVRPFPWQASVPVVEILVIVGFGMILLLA